MTVRIMFKYPNNYIDVTDPAEVDALVEALVIRLDSRDPKRQSASVFSPFTTRDTVQGPGAALRSADRHGCST